MTRDQAISVLGLPADASADAIQRRIKQVESELTAKLKNAPSADLRSTYQKNLQQLAVVRGAATGASSTGTPRDLPASGKMPGAAASASTSASAAGLRSAAPNNDGGASPAAQGEAGDDVTPDQKKPMSGWKKAGIAAGAATAGLAATAMAMGDANPAPITGSRAASAEEPAEITAEEQETLVDNIVAAIDSEVGEVTGRFGSGTIAYTVEEGLEHVVDVEEMAGLEQRVAPTLDSWILNAPMEDAATTDSAEMGDVETGADESGDYQSQTADESSWIVADDADVGTPASGDDSWNLMDDAPGSGDDTDDSTL